MKFIKAGSGVVGFGIGVMAPKILSKAHVSSTGRTALKSVIKGYLSVASYVTDLVSKSRKGFQDVVSEARAECSASKVEVAPTAIAPAETKKEETRIPPIPGL